MRLTATRTWLWLALTVPGCAATCGGDTLPDDTDGTDRAVDDTDDTDAPTGSDDASETDAVDTDDTDDSDAPDTDLTPACTLGAGDGTAEAAWDALTPGSEVGVFLGGQGRWHVFGLVRCTGLEGGGLSGSASGADLSNPNNPTVTWALYDEEHVLLAGYEGLRRPMARAEDIGLVNELLVFWTAASFDESVDRDATLTFSIADVTGSTWSTEVAVRLVDGAGADTDAP